MKEGKRKIVIAASCLAIMVGLGLFVMGQGGVVQSPSPTFPGVVMELQEEGREREVDWSKLPCTAIAWVYVPGTSIDYPVAMGSAEDPGFYLSHDIEGLYSVWGTPYVANECEQGLESPLAMIYGHHMSDGTMFVNFANFSSKSFVEAHDEIVLYTPQRVIYLEPRVVNVINANAKTVQLEFESQENLNLCMANEVAESEVVLGEVPSEQRVYVFVTCSYETQNSRTVVYAVEEVK